MQIARIAFAEVGRLIVVKRSRMVYAYAAEMSPSRTSLPPPSGHAHAGLLALTLGAMGVVYGDIGTSPLYAVSEIFYSHDGITPTADHAIGTVSLILWTITIVVLFKYLLIVLRADNDSEGGTFALYGLLHKHKRRGLQSLLWLLMLAAGLLFGEGIITPAISVLSAVEGLRMVTPTFDRFVVPLTLGILTVLFVAQRKGTAKVGRVFGPIILAWFVAIGLLGLRQIIAHPQILAALHPLRGLALLHTLGVHGSLKLLGGVVLAITGGEALYADMGHFGPRPIRASFLSLVYPALVLSYLGQGAYLLSGQAVANKNVFYSLVPQALLVPMVILATFAAVIASQALISGAFSLATQAVALGLFPRLQIVQTHATEAGQTYVPFINWMLFLGSTTLAVRFGSSSALASAYGMSLSGVMLTTSLAMVAVTRLVWRWSWIRITLLFVPFACLDLAFLTAKSLHFMEGGYIPLFIGIVFFVVMTTWRWGRKATFAAYSNKATMTIGELITLKASTALFDRNAVVMVPKSIHAPSDNVPALMQILWDRWGVLPKNIIFVEVLHRKTPYVHSARYRVKVFERSEEHGCVISVAVTFGFLEEPNVEKVLEGLAAHHEIDLPPDPHKWIVHVSQENVLSAEGSSVFSRIRLRLFALLRQVSTPSYYYYGLGNEVQLTTEVVPVRLR